MSNLLSQVFVISSQSHLQPCISPSASCIWGTARSHACHGLLGGRCLPFLLQIMNYHPSCHRRYHPSTITSQVAQVCQQMRSLRSARPSNVFHGCMCVCSIHRITAASAASAIVHVQCMAFELVCRAAADWLDPCSHICLMPSSH
jgi:hypothetical protein